MGPNDLQFGSDHRLLITLHAYMKLSTNNINLELSLLRSFFSSFFSCRCSFGNLSDRSRGVRSVSVISEQTYPSHDLGNFLVALAHFFQGGFYFVNLYLFFFQAFFYPEPRLSGAIKNIISFGLLSTHPKGRSSKSGLPNHIH